MQMDLDSAIPRRKALLELALRRARPGSGSTLDFLTTRTWKDPGVDLHRLQTPFVIVGGVATALYMPLRLTLDVDLLVLAADAPRLHRELGQGGCTRKGLLTIGGTSWQTPDGNLVDVLEWSETWVQVAIQTPNRSPDGLPVIALPYLVLMKLAASRPQDLADLSRMLGLADEATLRQVRDTVAAYRGEDAADLESLITLGQLELAGDSGGQEGGDR